jgi:FkbM family methyltransferase
MTIPDLIRRVRHAPVLESQDWLWRGARRPYRALLAARARSVGVTRTVNGMRIRVKAPFQEIASNWEEAPFAAFRAALAPGSIVFDIGASFGLYSIAAGQVVGPDGAVIAFEPAQETSALLREHLRLNGVGERVEVVEQVVSDVVGDQVFWEQRTSLGASLAEAAAQAGRPFVDGELQRRSVPGTTIDAFCAERGLSPDVVKIDVEGAEARVLRGARHLLGARRAAILLEIHPWALEQLGDSADVTLALLGDAGWSAELLATDGNTAHYLCRPGPG